jgi:hypothetical protein
MVMSGMLCMIRTGAGRQHLLLLLLLLLPFGGKEDVLEMKLTKKKYFVICFHRFSSGGICLPMSPRTTMQTKCLLILRSKC